MLESMEINKINIKFLKFIFKNGHYVFKATYFGIQEKIE